MKEALALVVVFPLFIFSAFAMLIGISKIAIALWLVIWRIFVGYTAGLMFLFRIIFRINNNPAISNAIVASKSRS
jgi:hypothetical protein